jgi:hypothetical protein
VVLHGEISSATAISSGCRFHPRCYRARLMAKRPGIEGVTREAEALPRICVERDPALAPATQGHLAACHFSGESDADAVQPV